MRNLKRVLSLALALVMVLGMMVITTSAATFAEEEIENVEAVEVMNALGIIKGDGGKFYPDRILTRAEAAKILAYATMGPDVETYLVDSDATPFEDVPAGRWYTKYITYCKNLKLIHGVTDTEFQPNEKLTVVAYGKLLLGAIGFDTTEYTGSNWVNAVAEDMKTVGLDIVKFDSKTEIDRDTACQMALIAMKHTTTSTTWKVVSAKNAKEVVGTYNTELEADLKAAEMNTILKDSVKVVKAEATDYLLNTVYKFTATRDNDDFGRPGNKYSNGKEGAEKVEMFYADEAVATYKNAPVIEKDLAAALGAAEEKTVKITKITEDGQQWKGDASHGNDADGVSKYVNPGATMELYNDKAYKHGVPGFGMGITVEIYATETEGEFEMVAIREYLGEVKKVNPANEKDPTSKRSIDVYVAGLGTATIVTEDYAEKDMVIVNDDNTTFHIVKVAESVKGTPTKIVNGVYVIGEGQYAKSQLCAEDITLKLGTEGEWYLDSFGNLMADKVKVNTKDPVYYGYLVDTEGVLYKAGTESLLDTKDAVEAQEVIQMITAEGETVIYNTAWKYVTNEKTGKVEAVEFVNAAKQVVADTTDEDKYTETKVYDPGTLAEYTLKDGKVASVKAISNDTSKAAILTTGKAILADDKGDAVYSGLLTDETVVFLTTVNATTKQPETAVYVGVNNVPSVKFDKINAFVSNADNSALFDVLVIDGTLVEEKEETTETNYVYFADGSYTEEYDAEAEKSFFIYENIYVNGVKSETAMKFEKAQDGVAGKMYAFTTEKGVTTLGEAALISGGDVKLVQSGFFQASAITYVDADTVYVQITETGLTAVEALPSIEDYTVTIKFIGTADKDTGAVDVVYFTAVEK